jgi:programmed cell death 6-interacting protein
VFINSSIASLNLPALLAAAELTTLPSSILKQAEEVRTGGGSQALYDMWDQAQKASLRNSEILEDAFNALDEEHESDDTLRSKYTTGKAKYFVIT